VKKMIWLTSYPKSGNTWLRMLIGEIQGENEQEDSEQAEIASNRLVLEEFTAVDTSFLTNEEAELLRPEVNDWLAKKNEKIVFRKNHDAYRFLANGRSLAGNPDLFKTIYIIRNPLSIVASLANHFSISLAEAIIFMNNNESVLAKNEKRLHYQLRQKLFSWSNHVLSWTKEKNLELFLLKYEDLHLKPLEILRKALSFSGLNIADSEINRALEKNSFKKVSDAEDLHGFSEKPRKMKKFFRKGSPDSWRDELTPEQAEIVVRNHWQVMKEFGYLTEEVLDFCGVRPEELEI